MIVHPQNISMPKPLAFNISHIMCQYQILCVILSTKWIIITMSGHTNLEIVMHQQIILSFQCLPWPSQSFWDILLCSDPVHSVTTPEVS